ncbi:MAG: hypothetical protein U1F43_26625 [Myxococcota bacterium]
MHHRARPLLALVAPLLALALGSACDAINKLDNIDVTAKGQTTIPGKTVLDETLGTFPAFGGFSDFSITDSETFQNKKYKADQVDSVHLKRLVLRTLTPAGQDLSYLGTVTFFVEAPGRAKIELAHQSTFPAGQSEVAFAVTDAELKDYLLAEQSTITTEASGSKHPDQDTVLEVEATFDVDVNVL